jgi:glucose-6-phosphate 1-dehydrogenase
MDPVLDVWKALPPRNFPNYAAGTWGPDSAAALIERDRRHWRQIETDSTQHATRAKIA